MGCCGGCGGEGHEEKKEQAVEQSTENKTEEKETEAQFFLFKMNTLKAVQRKRHCLFIHFFYSYSTDFTWAVIVLKSYFFHLL